jgi:hypothetical protein
MVSAASDLRQWRWFLLAAVLIVLRSGDSFAASTTIYSTGFEEAEGYDSRFTLAGQQGWRVEGTGGNGLFSETNGFPGGGQQAYVGAFSPNPNAEESLLTVWQPINLVSIPAHTPIVKFSVQMEIVDSTNGLYDCFRWSVFNTNVDRLFTLDFDNSDLSINYRLDGTNAFIFTGQTFSSNVRYQLLITMDFSRNRWSATLNDTLLLTNQLISTTPSTPLNLGDVDAVWFYRDAAAPGNNLMVFDNYQIKREGVSGPQPELINLGHVPHGAHLLRLWGEDGRRYAIEATVDFRNWTALRTNTADNGEFDFADTTAAGFPSRFYRARLVP